VAGSPSNPRAARFHGCITIGAYVEVIAANRLDLVYVGRLDDCHDVLRLIVYRARSVSEDKVVGQYAVECFRTTPRVGFIPLAKPLLCNSPAILRRACRLTLPGNNPPKGGQKLGIMRWITDADCRIPGGIEELFRVMSEWPDRPLWVSAVRATAMTIARGRFRRQVCLLVY
jgi:hypothetical protein